MDRLPFRFLVHAINQALGNKRQDRRLQRAPFEVRPRRILFQSLTELVADMNAGKVDVLFDAGRRFNPIYSAAPPTCRSPRG